MMKFKEMKLDIALYKIAFQSARASGFIQINDIFRILSIGNEKLPFQAHTRIDESFWYNFSQSVPVKDSDNNTIGEMMLWTDYGLIQWSISFNIDRGIIEMADSVFWKRYGFKLTFSLKNIEIDLKNSEFKPMYSKEPDYLYAVPSILTKADIIEVVIDAPVMRYARELQEQQENTLSTINAGIEFVRACQKGESNEQV